MPIVKDWTGTEVGEISLDLRVAKETTAKGLVHRISPFRYSPTAHS